MCSFHFPTFQVFLRLSSYLISKHGQTFPEIENPCVPDGCLDSKLGAEIRSSVDVLHLSDCLFFGVFPRIFILLALWAVFLPWNELPYSRPPMNLFCLVQVSFINITTLHQTPFDHSLFQSASPLAATSTNRRHHPLGVCSMTTLSIL